MERKGHHHTARHRQPAGDAGPEIESLPWFGTTWYTGGPAYWLRRALLSLLMLLVLALIAGIVAIFVVPIFGSSGGRTPGLIALGIVTAVSLVTFVWTWRRMSRTPDFREKVRDVKEGIYFTYAWQGIGLVVLILIVVGLVVGGVVGRSVAALAGALVGLAFFGAATFALGGMLAVFVKSVVQEPQPVRDAREELRELHPQGGLDTR
jgi:hypothetical protein